MNKTLLDVICKSKALYDEAFDAEAYKKEVEDARIAKEAVAVETKANEVMNTDKADFGSELIPTNVYIDPLLDLVPTYSKFIPMLPGNHGSNMPISAKVPIIGEADMFYGNTQWTTGSPVPADAADNGPATSDITIIQGQFIISVSLSKRELNYSPENLEQIVRERINLSAARTIDALILNADDAAANNINDDGGTPATTLYYKQQASGVRETVLADTNTHDVGTLTEWDFISVLSLLDQGYQADLNNLLWIMPANCYNKSLLLDAVLTVDKFWPAATFHSGVLAKAFGIDILVARDRPALALATGLVHTSTGNSYSSFGLIYKPAIQYGFGQALEIDVVKVPGKGVQLVATFEFGQALAYDKVGLGKNMAMGINVTV